MNLRRIAVGLCFLLASASAVAVDTGAPGNGQSVLDHYSSNAQELVLRALSFVGIHYHPGGESPDSGFDCSGLVRHVFREALGLSLPRTSREISLMGDEISADELKPGDLVFYDTLRRGFSHVGIYLGEYRFVHAPASGGEVRVEDMRQGYWLKRFNGARRIATGETTPAN